ncbi:DUF397 domain-containing protein [Streptomyces celluloflavus]|uniref:DUF397 domain-containing protein n=1 Tax=Streptomyces celluloflavus TaxID=58344 RepID=UPI0034614E82|nr:DUF397 domain-containing protein [Streptomyces celluloflavus]
MNTTSAATAWVKSTYSGPDDGSNCVEWSPASVATAGAVPVRDSKHPDGPALRFGPGVWAAFVSAVRRDGFTGV